MTALQEAAAKIAVAERMTEEGHFGVATFFSWRAERIALQALDEAELAEATPDSQRISGSRVNLRSGPSTEHDVIAVLVRRTPVFPERHEEEWILVHTASGRVGWVHASLVEETD